VIACRLEAEPPAQIDHGGDPSVQGTKTGDVVGSLRHGLDLLDHMDGESLFRRQGEGLAAHADDHEGRHGLG
jgi:hypothetical protein